jgi:hypothetical protein
MTVEENVGGLSAEETAYFESGGEKPLVIENETDNAGKVQPEAETQGEQGRDDKGRFVPHQALHAEREEHKKTRAELAEMRQFKAVMEDRWNTLLKATEKPKEQEDAPPDPSVDIFAYSKWQQEQFNKLQSKIAEKEQQETQARQSQERDRAIWSHWQNSVQSYASQQADFGDAATFLADLRDKQLAALGVVDGRLKDKAARDAQVNEELKGIILAAEQQNINPAEAVYQIAQQYGYQPKAADPGGLKLPENLQKIAQAQEQSKTIGTAPARGGADALSLDAIMSMPRAEFETWMKEPKNSRLFDRLMGA